MGPPSAASGATWPMRFRQRRLRWQILGAGAALLLVGLVASHFLAKRLSAPVAKLAVDSEENRARRKRVEAVLATTHEELQRSTRFSADASHQLKTPVTVLRAGIEELLRREDLQPAVYDELSALHHQTYRLTGVIEDLLLLSRMDAGRLQIDFGAVNLTQLIDEWLEDLTALPDPLGLEVKTEVPTALYIAGERRYTSLILQNLLENARKYQSHPWPNSDPSEEGQRLGLSDRRQHRAGHSGGNAAAHLRAFFARREWRKGRRPRPWIESGARARSAAWGRIAAGLFERKVDGVRGPFPARAPTGGKFSNARMNSLRALAVVILISSASPGARAQDFLDRVDEALTFTAFNDNVRGRLSGTLDLEVYFFQQPAPGLILTEDDSLFNYRLTPLLRRADWAAGLFLSCNHASIPASTRPITA